ncbi:hypothetical protein BDD43_3442 [Mucilaginibacter gracilis]|uniref:Uncharacterized protein n=1 Tax=Mucilaginibacter gracilis TaxID=423350 RepID=A0A495J5I1_9SPHI|nr:hypothetical protein [Mucilaginibacter gracilis]RKR83239.1 hypothetical protein BDD43_3442 [Mucilaginibacter gracilis]
MEDKISIQDDELLICDVCFMKVYHNDMMCNHCGYPLKGNSAKQKIFIKNRNINEIDFDAYKKNIKTAGIALYWVAASCALYGILQYRVDADEELKFYVLIGNLIAAMAFVSLGSWSRKKTLAAILSGTALYVTLQVLNMAYDPATIPRNFIVKILVAIALVRGLISAINIEKVKKELNIRK